jgi:predicted dehydrogenase
MARVAPVKVGLVGSGAISKSYLSSMINNFSILDVVGCSDIIPERSKNRAEEFGIEQLTNEEIFNNPEIEIVVNTTYPLSHYEVSKAALLAGKHVHIEKMMAVMLSRVHLLYRWNLTLEQFLLKWCLIMICFGV